jgi:alpha-galactosidase
VAVALINRGSVGSDVTLKASEVGLLDAPKLARNLWSQEDIDVFTAKLTQRVQPHETILLKINSTP